MSERRRRARARSAWLRLVVTGFLAVAAATVLAVTGPTPDGWVLLSFSGVLAGRALLDLPVRRRHPRRVRRLAEAMVLLAVAGLGLAVRAVVTGTATSLPYPVLVLAAVGTLVVAVVVLLIARQQDPSA